MMAISLSALDDRQNYIMFHDDKSFWHFIFTFYEDILNNTQTLLGSLNCLTQ